MLRFQPDIFLRLARTTGTVRTTADQGALFGKFAQKIPELAKPLPGEKDHSRIEPDESGVTLYLSMEAQCNELGLDAAAATAKRIQELYREGCTVAEMYDLLREFDGRLIDQLANRLCWMIEPEKSRLFTDTTPFGPEVADRFPSATLDIEEAGKCLALGRDTAAVFHLMRVMEAGLRALGASLNDPSLDPATNPSWDRILSRGDKELAKRAIDRSPEWKAKPDFFAGAHATLRSVSTAWRNPTMHVEKTYGEDKALDVFNAVRGFMRHLAIELREPGQ